MLQLLQHLLESDFMPHGYCFGWKPDVLWLHVASDAVIALSYFLIPFTLIYVVRVRRDLDFRWMAGLFGVFILSCGASHVFGIVTLWHPVYVLEGAVKALTAASSLPTALLLIWLTPKVIALPSPRQLRAANEEVVRLNRELEGRVEERTTALTEAEQRYRQLFELNPLPMWVREPGNGRILAVNPAAQELYGYAESEFVGMNIRTLVLSGEPKEGDDISKPILQRHARKSGAAIHAEIRIREIQFGSHAAWLVLSTDVTERKALEDQLRHSQKMQAIGRLAGGIAHDFNNLLTVILGYAAVAKNKFGSENPIQRYVTEIQRAAEHAASLTGQLLAFSRKQVIQPRVLDLITEVRGTEDILHRLLGEDINLAVITDDAPCLINADRGQLSQIIMNLVVNARDAMPTGGNLTIEVHSVERSQEDISGGNIRPAGRFSMLVVSDDGIGMDAETLTHIFEPFFTTKETGSGTGLGLATVYGIVSQHHGWVDVYSEPKHGSTFKIYFPAAKGNAAPAVAVKEPQQPVSATILLVEDQASVRLLAEDLLAEAGHRVLSAANGRAALELVERHEGKIDLLVTDVVMPEMNGPDLADHLLRRQPDLIVLYVSGYTDHALLHRGAIESGTAFLQKPFPPEALREKVDELLRAGNQADEPDRPRGSQAQSGSA